ncbi:MAG TPA: hypothetical protein VIJ52_02000, partial [Pseudolabrys sp.]
MPKQVARRVEHTRQDEGFALGLGFCGHFSLHSFTRLHCPARSMSGHNDHPADAEFVGQHAEAFGEECL